MHLTTSASGFLNQRMEPPLSPAPAGRDASIQGMRACAALFVLVMHISPDIPGLGFWLRNIGAGAGGVMLFFVISGYVIGLTTRHAWHADSRRSYWRRRLGRLAPLYYLSVLVTLIFAALIGPALSVPDVIAHLLCIQNMDSYGPYVLKPAWLNGALWSLHYEMVFYTLFLLVWKYRPTAGVAFGITGALAIILSFSPGGTHVLAGYASGFFFWLAGLWLAWCRVPAPSPEPARPPAYPAAGLLLMFTALHASVPEHTLRALLGIPWTSLAFVNPFNLIYLPACVLLVGCATRRLPPINLACKLLCVLPPAVTLIGALAHNSHIHEPRWGVTAAATLIGGALLWTSVGSKSLPQLAWLGAISYSLYLFHTPIQYILVWLLPVNPYLLALLVAVVSLGCAWFLEAWLPSWRKRRAGIVIALP